MARRVLPGSGSASSFTRRALLGVAIGVGLVGLGHGMLARAAEPAVTIPPPALDPKPAAEGPHTIVLAGGCFWGVQGVFEHTKGVIRAVSGYSGGSKETAHYEMVGTETDRPRRVGAGHIRSETDFIWQDFADLFFGRA